MLSRAPFAWLTLLAACSAADVADDDLADEAALEGSSVDVIFSPQPAASTHTVRIAQLIADARYSVDVAMYSFSDAEVARALEAAVARGVKVRMIFETAGEDTRLTGDAKANSKSGRLESKGIDVRYVNKIMHHKFVIVDGPRDVKSRARTAKVASGSANWSGGAGTKYDENTMFFSKVPELTLRLQREFDHLWSHSRDFALATPIAQELSTLAIPDSLIPNDKNVDALFTSDNFKVTDTTISTNAKNTISDALVLAIKGANESIHIASGHLRSRPVALALMEKKQASPNVDIRVYLDGQEFISVTGHNEQQAKLDGCLADAGANESKQRKCTDKGFLYGYAVGKAGVDVRYKYYAYRWDASYAKQMHNKFFLIDKKTLFSGSYNLSDNAEHETFENVLVFRAPKHSALINAFEERFSTLWDTGRDGTFARVKSTIATAGTIPLVFDASALTHDEVTSLKRLIRDNCPAADSAAYRQDAAGHQSCPRGRPGPAAPPAAPPEPEAPPIFRGWSRRSPRSP